MKPSKGQLMENLLIFHTSRMYLTTIIVKEVLRSSRTKGRESPSMTRRMVVHGLALTSSRRSPKKKSII